MDVGSLSQSSSCRRLETSLGKTPDVLHRMMRPGCCMIVHCHQCMTVCASGWMEGKKKKKCKSLWIKVLYECSHLPFMLVRWPAGESGSLKDTVRKKCLIQYLNKAFWEGFPQDFKVCLWEFVPSWLQYSTQNPLWQIWYLWYWLYRYNLKKNKQIQFTSIFFLFLFSINPIKYFSNIMFGWHMKPCFLSSLLYQDISEPNMKKKKTKKQNQSVNKGLHCVQKKL